MRTFNMFRIYKGDTVIIEGESPLAITGLDPNTDVEKGEYQVVRVDGDKESDRVDIPAFTTLSVVNSRETLVEAINKAGAGDTVTIDEGFIINKDKIGRASSRERVEGTEGGI